MDQIFLSITILKFQEQLRFAPVQLTENSTFYVLRKKWQFLLQILFLLFPSFFFSTFFPSLFHTSELQMPKITHLDPVLCLYESTLSKHLCQPGLIRLMFPHSFINVFSGVKKGRICPDNF